MKRLFLWSLVATATCGLPGCHDGHGEHGCIVDVECAPGYLCDLTSNECRRPEQRCSKPTDCGTNETCGAERVCRVGDCSFHGCLSGFSCQVVGGRYACVAGSGGSGAGGAAGDLGPSATAGAENGGAAGSSADEAGQGGSAGNMEAVPLSGSGG